MTSEHRKKLHPWKNGVHTAADEKRVTVLPPGLGVTETADGKVLSPQEKMEILISRRAEILYDLILKAGKNGISPDAIRSELGIIKKVWRESASWVGARELLVSEGKIEKIGGVGKTVERYFATKFLENK